MEPGPQQDPQAAVEEPLREGGPSGHQAAWLGLGLGLGLASGLRDRDATPTGLLGRGGACSGGILRGGLGCLGAAGALGAPIAPPKTPPSISEPTVLPRHEPVRFFSCCCSGAAIVELCASCRAAWTARKFGRVNTGLPLKILRDLRDWDCL